MFRATVKIVADFQIISRCAPILRSYLLDESITFAPGTFAPRTFAPGKLYVGLLPPKTFSPGLFPLLLGHFPALSKR